MKRSIIFSLTAALFACTAFASTPQLAGPKAPDEQQQAPHSIIIMIGDGMGPAVVSGYRYYKDNPDTLEVEETVFDRLLTGTARTHPAPVSGYVTDSAASATALATGVKTYNGAISVDENKQPVTTIMEMARERGMATGVAVTSQINHATPAAFLAHNESRRNYDELAASYVESPADVMLGGGQKYFSQDMLATLKQKGFSHIERYQDLEGVQHMPVIGLFGEVGLPAALDDDTPNRLALLTEHALRLLSAHPKGFVLMVEGSQIDWAGHDNDIAGVMHETEDFANAIEVVEQYVRANPNATMVVTADHATGGLTLAKDGEYVWKPKMIADIKQGSRTLAEATYKNDNWQALVADALALQPTEDELASLQKARDAVDKKIMAKAIRAIVDDRTNTGWTTGGHTAVDVPVLAFGRGSELFNGHQDNIEIATQLMSLLPPKAGSPMPEASGVVVNDAPAAAIKENND
ncbi:alkaline phosphatase [Paraferrimonas haliotis]|uniref:Alkaline phosphatase n=1 Tax=Paraferrimonas haliotis TaxID=2013866 RepID=A0AA37TRT1_9GAMM|nr:alkaline phosphatase [Paraferrimonas haliotis]GLS83097.1 alkaline phosphatase [Paraferrimonas haliotis]